MVAEQVLTYGLVERSGLVDGHERQCDDSRTQLGLWLRWDLVTGDLDVCVNAVVANLR